MLYLKDTTGAPVEIWPELTYSRSVWYVRCKNDRLVRFKGVDQVPFRAIETVTRHGGQKESWPWSARREGRSECRLSWGNWGRKTRGRLLKRLRRESARFVWNASPQAPNMLVFLDFISSHLVIF